jgi:hypothetical protein
MRAILVSVGYSDLLALTLPFNRKHFSSVLVVTSPADEGVVGPICKAAAADMLVTDAFYKGRGAGGEPIFRKWKALEEGLDLLRGGPHGWLCVAGSTPVLAEGIKYASRKHYKGPMVSIKTSGGRSLTLTPDHKVLSDHGWVAAKSLCQGDNLLYVKRTNSTRTPQVDQHPAQIGQVIDAALERNSPAHVRTVLGGMDLETNLSDSNVKVVRADSKLRRHLESGSQSVRQCLLESTDSTLAFLTGQGHLPPDLFSAGNPLGFRPDSIHTLLTNLQTVSGRPDLACLTVSPVRDTRQPQVSFYGPLIHLQRLGNRSLALPRLVATDNVLSVQIIPWCDHVYDLSTENGWFLGDDIIIHNCVMDADILWPRNLPSNLEATLRPGCLTTPLRRMMTDITGLTTATIPPEDRWGEYPIHRNVAEWAGYSQIFHTLDPVLPRPPWYDTRWKHAGGADSHFQARWPAPRKIRPPWEVLHLGSPGTNWFGRASRLVDGSLSVDSQILTDTLISTVRARRPGPDRHNHELLPPEPSQ